MSNENEFYERERLFINNDINNDNTTSDNNRTRCITFDKFEDTNILQRNYERNNSKFDDIIKYMGEGDGLMGLTILFSYDYLHLTHPCICQYIETSDANTTELEKIIFS